MFWTMNIIGHYMTYCENIGHYRTFFKFIGFIGFIGQLGPLLYVCMYVPVPSDVIQSEKLNVFAQVKKT